MFKYYIAIYIYFLNHEKRRQSKLTMLKILVMIAKKEHYFSIVIVVTSYSQFLRMTKHKITTYQDFGLVGLLNKEKERKI